jgi:hypothetical protein
MTETTPEKRREQRLYESVKAMHDDCNVGEICHAMRTGDSTIWERDKFREIWRNQEAALSAYDGKAFEDELPENMRGK